MKMKKMFIVLSSIFVFSVIAGCAAIRYNIVDISLKAEGTLAEGGATTIADSLKFIIIPKTEQNKTAALQNAGLFGGCYATTVDEHLDNWLLRESFSLSFDKPFMYKGKEIAANKNLLVEPGVKDEIKVTHTEGIRAFGYSYIDFRPSFLQDTVFEGEYVASFSCKATNNVRFEKTVKIAFSK